jgi:hypothetical protein
MPPFSKTNQPVRYRPNLNAPDFPTDKDIQYLSTCTPEIHTPWGRTFGKSKWPSRVIPKIDNKFRESAIGTLDVLPLEILHMILMPITLKDLSKVTQTSHRGREIVQSLPFYEVLMDNAYPAFHLLGKTGLAKYFSFANLLDAFRSEKCVGCSELGAFLFLPACVRSCGICLRLNPELKAVQINHTLNNFGQSQVDSNELPIMSALYGRRRWRRQRDIIAMRLIKPPALQGHGSQDASIRLASDWYRHLMQWPRLPGDGSAPSRATASMQPSEDRVNIVALGLKNYDCDDEIIGITFPFLSSGGTSPQIQKPLGCPGCIFIYNMVKNGRLSRCKYYEKRIIDLDTLPAWAKYLVVRNSNLFRYNTPPLPVLSISDLQEILPLLQADRWLSEGFAKHVKTCPHVEDFIKIRNVSHLRRYD